MITAQEAFEAWCRNHPAKWNMGKWVQNGVFKNYTDPETDTAWLGFQAAWELRLVLDNETFDRALEEVRPGYNEALAIVKRNPGFAGAPDPLAVGIKSFLARLMYQS